MVQVSMIGFLVNGAFVDMARFDLIYHWMGVVASLRLVTDKELEALASRQQAPVVREPVLSDAGLAPASTGVFRPGAALRGR
jgi:hypothetical protein